MQGKFVKNFTSPLSHPKNRRSNFFEGPSLFEFPLRDARRKIASPRHFPVPRTATNSPRGKSDLSD